MATNENDAVLVVAIVLFILLTFGGFGMMGFGGIGRMMGGSYSGLGFMGTFGWLIMILISVALVLFILWLVKQLQGGRK